MPSVEMFRMLGSGTESVMAAIRAARAYTGKRFVVKMGGAYHGWSDQMVYGLRVPGTWRLRPRASPSEPPRLHPGGLSPTTCAALRRKLRRTGCWAARPP